MSQQRSATSLELEIQTLLKHYGALELTADALIKKYEDKKLSLAEFETLATFFLHCGFCATLTDLIARKLGDESKIPWGHFAEALFMANNLIEPELKQALIDGADEERSLSELARSHYLDDFDEEMVRQRSLRRKGFVERHALRRKELIDELDVLRSQGLHSEEEKLIDLLNRFFPQDGEVEKMRAALRERLVLDFIAKRPRPKHQIFIPFHEPKDPETIQTLNAILNSMRDLLKDEPELRSWLPNDFALSLMIWEDFDAALDILEQGDPTNRIADWLKAEILLRGRKFAELMNHLTYLEGIYNEDPDTIYAVQYLRAQALWGLNQKNIAVEILEGMMQARPDYRSAAALLDEWKEDLS